MLRGRDYKKKLNIKFDTVGAALIYAISEELPKMLQTKGPWNGFTSPADDDFDIDDFDPDDLEVFEDVDDDSGKEPTKAIDVQTMGIHFYAVLTCLYMLGYIDGISLAKITLWIRMGSRVQDATARTAEKILTEVLKELKSHINFTSTEECVDRLDAIILHRWHFCLGYSIVDNYAGNICLCGDGDYTGGTLYFTIREADGYKFYKISTARIYGFTDLEHSPEREQLGSGFNHIEAYDPAKNCIYLRAEGQDSFYYAYSIESDTFFIRDGKFFGLKNGNLFAVRKGMITMTSPDGNKKNVDAKREDADYTECDGYYLVEPNEDSRPFFAPYHIGYDGLISPCTHKEKISVVWPFVIAGLVIEERITISREFLIEPEKITLAGIKEFIKKAEVNGFSARPSNISKYVYDKIMDILDDQVEENKLSPDEDLTDFFLACVKFETEKHGLMRNETFPTVKTYARFKVLLGLTSKQEKTNINLVKTVVGISKDSEITGEGFPNLARKEILRDKPLIGTFRFNKANDFDADSYDISAGYIMGGYVMPKHIPEGCTGFVAYDSRQDFYYVNTHNTELSDAQKADVNMHFGICERNVCYIVQNSESPVRKRIAV